MTASASDHIDLVGIVAYGHHGVLGWERELGQPFIIDVRLWLSLAAAGASNDLSLTVNYGTLAGEILAAVESEPVDLIEAVAERVAEVGLAYPIVESVRVTIHKPRAPVPVALSDVSVTITRSRS